MLGRRRKRKLGPDDSVVAEVERILSGAAPMSSLSDLSERPVVTNALDLCACITIDGSPNWLIYDTADGYLAWCHVPDGVEGLDSLRAQSTAGGHSDPAETLAWLRHEQSHPWGPVGSGSSDPGVVESLLAKIDNRRAGLLTRLLTNGASFGGLGRSPTPSIERESQSHTRRGRP